MPMSSWAREWREYRYVTPKYMKKFVVNPPCPRAPLAPGQVADPTSIKRGEDFPEEWARRQAKLARQAKEAVRKFNEDSGSEGIAEELGLEGIVGEALGLPAGLFDIAFFGLTAKASAEAAAAAKSSLNFLTASLACLANLAWCLAHSSG